MGLTQVNSFLVAGYIEQLTQEVAAPTVKQHLAAIRRLFDFLVTGQIVPTNPAAAVRGPKHVVKKGRASVLSAAETRALLDAIDTSRISGLRDRALIALMVYSFARVGAVVAMNVADYFLSCTLNDAIISPPVPKVTPFDWDRPSILYFHRLPKFPQSPTAFLLLLTRDSFPHFKLRCRQCQVAVSANYVF